MGTTTSKRDIIALTTPETLDVSKIWDLWLPKYIPESVYKQLSGSEKAKFRLELLFAIAAPIPRAIQYIVAEVRDYFKKPQDSDMLKAIDSKALEELYTKSFTKLERNYYSICGITVLPKHARAILFESNINLDENLVEMVKYSLLTNSLKSINEKNLLYPKTSTLSMKIFLKDKSENYWKSVRHAIEKLDEQFTEEPNKVKLGQFLEAAVRGLINARLHVMMKLALDAKSTHSEKLPVTIKELLLLDDLDRIKGASDKLLTKLEYDFLVPPCKKSLSKIFLSDSYTEKKKFFSSANIEPSIVGNIFELLPFPDKECFDYGFLFSAAIEGKPFAVFIDTKSGRQLPSKVVETKNQDFFNFSDFPSKGSQALHMLEIAKEAKAWDPATVKKNSLLEALREDNFLYVYVNTGESVPSFAVGDFVMQLGETDSKCLLSFLLEPYRLVRAASTLPQEFDKKERYKENSHSPGVSIFK